MIISIDELLEGKGTIIKDKEYFPTKRYVEPFLDKVGKLTSDIRVQVELPKQVTIVGDNQDITYNRVWIQAVLPEDIWDDHKEVIGLVYGLDVKKPIAKIYRGGLNMACLNLCTFNPSFLNAQEIQPETPISYKPVETLLEQTNDLKIWLDKLSETYIPRDKNSIERELGRWVNNSIRKYYSAYENSKVKLASTTVISAFKSLFIDSKSEYYRPPTEDAVDMFTVYNAFTKIITADEKDLINKYEKVLLLKDILEL